MLRIKVNSQKCQKIYLSILGVQKKIFSGRGTPPQQAAFFVCLSVNPIWNHFQATKDHDFFHALQFGVCDGGKGKQKCASMHAMRADDEKLAHADYFS